MGQTSGIQGMTHMAPACSRWEPEDHGYDLTDDPDQVTCQKQGCLSAVRFERYNRKRAANQTAYILEQFGEEFYGLESSSKIRLLDAKNAEIVDAITEANDRLSVVQAEIAKLYEQQDALYQVRPFSRA